MLGFLGPRCQTGDRCSEVIPFFTTVLVLLEHLLIQVLAWGVVLKQNVAVHSLLQSKKLKVEISVARLDEPGTQRKGYKEN